MEHPLQKRFREFIDAQSLWTEGDKILVAVSGGVDSMVMAELCLKCGFDFGIAHCNFNLRGHESDEDELFVENWARTNEVPVHSKSFDLGQQSVQVAAREARFTWFSELLQQFGYKKVATAHHLNDSFETAILNLSRGTGIRGLGIQTSSGEVVRPLLFASRQEIEVYASECQVNFREDSSNASSDYDRNKVRHEVIPKLLELNPSLFRTYANTWERLDAAAKLLVARVQEVKNEFTSIDEGMIRVRTDWVSKGEDRLVLAEILDGEGFSYAAVQQILAALDKPGKTFHSGDRTITIDRDVIFIGAEILDHGSMQILEPGKYNFAGREISVELTDSSGAEIDDNPNKAVLDASKVSFPLTLRSWQEGDKFQPLGMVGTKKVSDFLIDAKVPVAKKDRVMVLLSGEEICWLVGQRIAESAKVVSDTTQVLQISVI